MNGMFLLLHYRNADDGADAAVDGDYDDDNYGFWFYCNGAFDC